MPRTRNRKEMNPLDRNGQISRCIVCDLKMHWAKDCPHSKHIKQQSANVIEMMVDKLLPMDMKNVN